MLVQPVVSVNPREEKVIEFKGLNRRPAIEDGEMRWMHNVGNSEYPFLSQRQPRELINTAYSNPVQMMVKYEKLAVIDHPANGRFRFWYGGIMTELSWDSEPKMVAIGSKICFFGRNIAQWYQAKSTEEVAAGTFGELGASVSVNANIKVILSQEGIEILSGTQYMYENTASVLAELESDLGESAGVVATAAQMTVTTGARRDGSSQCMVKVECTGIPSSVQLVTVEIGTDSGVWKYATWSDVDSMSTFVVNTVVDLKGYSDTQNPTLRIKAWTEDGRYFYRTQAIEWSHEDFDAAYNTPTLQDSFRVDDVIEIKGQAYRVSTEKGMTTAEYNNIASILGLPTTQEEIDPNVSVSEYNAIAPLLMLTEEPNAEACDGELTETEAYIIGTKLGIVGKNETIENYSGLNIDNSALITAIEGNKVTFEDNTFNLTEDKHTDLRVEDNTYEISNPTTLNMPRPKAYEVFRSQDLAGRCVVVWTVDCPTDTQTLRRDTSYLFQVRELGTVKEWQTVHVLSSANGNLPAVISNDKSVFTTEVQTPANDIIYEFRIISVNENVQAQAQTYNITNYPKCASHNEVHLTLSGISMERYVPDLDFVVEYNNRLWGCNSTYNEIIACKLGDPTNWHYYQNTSADSYAASQGTDGVWTGCAAYSNHLVFFKEECLHKVYGSSPASFQITTQKAYGVMKGSSKSIDIVNDVVIYHSRTGWMAYNGEAPENISARLGDTVYSDVVSGTDRKRYYCSAYNGSEYEMLVFDTETGFWLKEDDTRAIEFCYFNGYILYVDHEGTLIRIGTGFEEPFEWGAIFGPFTEYIEDVKVLSKVKARIRPEGDATVTVSIRMDEGEWQEIGTYGYESYDGKDIWFVPRRCDRYEIKFSGIGRCRVESMTRMYRVSRGRP